MVAVVGAVMIKRMVKKAKHHHLVAAIVLHKEFELSMKGQSCPQRPTVGRLLFSVV